MSRSMPRHKNDALMVAAPRASMAEVERAGPAQLADSKRFWKIEKQEGDLTGQLGDLEQGTRQRNREFEAKLRAIAERIRGLEVGIEREVQEREESHAVMFAGLQEKLKAAAAAVEADAETSITDRFEPGLSEHMERIEADDARVEEFVHVTVPRIVDEQSGAVTRKLQKARETFDIENAKIAKRERKLVSRFETHVKGTAQSFEDEEATRVGKLWLLGEDLQAVEHMDDRGDESLQLSIVKTIKATRGDVAMLSKERGYQDGLLLDSLAHAQHKLQRCILETFGTKEEDDDCDDSRPGGMWNEGEGTPEHVQGTLHRTCALRSERVGRALSVSFAWGCLCFAARAVCRRRKRVGPGRNREWKGENERSNGETLGRC